MWIGAYWDKKDRYLYICPLPMIVFQIQTKKSKDKIIKEVLRKIDNERFDEEYQ